MITEFLWLTLLTLNEEEREALIGKFDEWLKCFLPKLKKNRPEPPNAGFSLPLRGMNLEDGELRQIGDFATLSERPIFIGRSEIKEENGKWQFLDGLKEKINSEGGEAIVFF
jgi:hypothetical protein